MNTLEPRRFVGIGILALWVITLALPVFSACQTGYDHVGGWFLLLFGWIGIWTKQPAWFANVFIVGVGIALALNKRPPILAGLFGGGLAAAAWWFRAWYDDRGEVPICHYHVGYWLWLAVAAIVLVVPFVVRYGASFMNAPPHGNG